MPCYTPDPSAKEILSNKLRELVKEIEGKKFNHRQSFWDFGVVDYQDSTRKLCKWCEANRSKIKDMSLELQIWWRDHQEDDAKRLKQEAADKKLKELKKRALGKLTPEEQKALKLRD